MEEKGRGTRKKCAVMGKASKAMGGKELDRGGNKWGQRRSTVRVVSVEVENTTEKER